MKQTLINTIEEAVSSVITENFEDLVQFAEEKNRLVCEDDYDIQRAIDVGMEIGLREAQSIIKQMKFDMEKIIREHDYNLGRVPSYWSVDDIYSLGYDCTKEEAMDVLDEAIDNIDSNRGINWDVLDNIAERNGLKLIENKQEE